MATTVTNTSFSPLQQIDAGVLNVGYAEAGPSDGPVVILLHGWPYDIHSFGDVAPLLAAASSAVRPRSPTRTTSPSSSITTAGGWGWRPVRRTMTTWNGGWRRVR
jgi:pimeloyl-ACP methyl ester carboxylesterase